MRICFLVDMDISRGPRIGGLPLFRKGLTTSCPDTIGSIGILDEMRKRIRDGPLVHEIPVYVELNPQGILCTCEQYIPSVAHRTHYPHFDRLDILDLDLMDHLMIVPSTLDFCSAD